MDAPISIEIDHRENKSGIPTMLEESTETTVTYSKLSVGDYLINEEICVERKTAEDFVQSILDTRLFKQCANLKKQHWRHIILIEGNPYKTRHDIDPNAIRGAIISVSVSWQIPVLFSKDTRNKRACLKSHQSAASDKFCPALRYVFRLA